MFFRSAKHVVVLAMSSLLLVGLASDALASSAAVPVTIVTQIDFSSFPLIHGTYDVVEGADTLGCSAGTFVDHQMSAAPTFSASRSFSTNLKTMTCTSGRAAGSVMTIIFKASLRPGPGDFNGPWIFFNGTGALENVSGGGDFWIVFLSDTSASETFTGVIRSV